MPIPTRLRQHLRAAAATALLMSAGAASAQSADFSTWAAAGDVLLGNDPSVATLSTAAVESGETPLSSTGALLSFELEPALGIRVGTLARDAQEGSGLTLSFTVAAPTLVRFNWTLASDEPFDPVFADRAFVVLDGTDLRPLATLAAGALTDSFAHIFRQPGSHSLAIGLVDIEDVTGVSTLRLSALQASVVPEPTSLGLLLAGLGLVAGVARRRR